MAERTKYRQAFSWIGALAVALLSGCATYTTPGPGVSIANLSEADPDVRELLKTEPAAPFPARLAAARVQGSGYSSQTNRCYGTGRYCVVTTRDMESEESFERIAKLPQVSGVALMNRLLLPPKLARSKICASRPRR